MPNQLALAGAVSTKPTRFTTLYTGRWSTGLWTNRSPLRDANTTRLIEKFYGSSNDALIAGLNVEITNRLTLARRPGCIIYDTGSTLWDSVNSFYSFADFHGMPSELGKLTEFIHVMVDQANALYTTGGSSGVVEPIWTKVQGAGQSYMQGIGNSLYWGDGISNKKWLRHTFVWEAGGDWTQPGTPLFTTFIEDPNGNIQQLTQQGVSGGSMPTWSTVLPDAGNDFQGGITIDGTAEWTCRSVATGSAVMNWGLVAPNGTLNPHIGAGGGGWAPNTRYSLPGVVIDSNGNLQQVITAGKSGSSIPTWATSIGVHTTDGSVVWNMIQTAASLVWQPHTDYAEGVYVVGNGCLFQGSQGNHVTVVEPITAEIWPSTGNFGQFVLTFPASGSSGSSQVGNIFTIQAISDHNPFFWFVTNGAGEDDGSHPVPFPSFPFNYQVAMYGTVTVPVAGQYSVSLKHFDGALLGIGGTATLVSGVITDPFMHTISAVNGYTLMCGTNLQGNYTDSCVVNFPTAGTYPVEINYAYGTNEPEASFSLFFNGQTPTPPPVESGSTQPIWPGWTTSFAPGYPTVYEQVSHQITWRNLGPVVDFVWQANINFTLPNTTIIDSNGNTEAPYRTGTSGSTSPTWATGINQLTLDAPNLIWINEGMITSPPTGTLSTFNGGWRYAIALVNTLDNTVSNCGPLSAATGNFIGAPGVTLPPASGLPTDLSTIDPQADYVAIFRTTDGGSIPFLIPGSITTDTSPATTIPILYTISLHDYILNGYTDTATDEQLNNLVEGPILGQNTPPGVGAINLAYHLNRIFFSIANTVYWTAGPDTPIGNGVNGVPPDNFDVLPARVIKIQPVALGALVFTVSGTYLVQGLGTSSNPIQGATPYLPNIGVLNYNAVAIDGSIIGLFTTENQFLILDPSAGTVDAGFPIGDQFRLNNGNLGQSWNPANVYVTCHTEGEDHAFYVSDGAKGWYRLMPTPAPETGYTWSPFAEINAGATSPDTSGCKAVQSVEVTPGIHKLLIGPVNTGHILQRDINTFTDDGNTYAANATIGSAVLAQPGQIAAVVFVATDSIRIGNPLIIGMLFEEALPYYTGPIEILKLWESDPTNLPESTSILGQRFYMDQLHESAALCRHAQIQVIFSPTDSVQNELLSLSVYGGWVPEL